MVEDIKCETVMQPRFYNRCVEDCSTGEGGISHTEYRTECGTGVWKEECPEVENEAQEYRTVLEEICNNEEENICENVKKIECEVKMRVFNSYVMHTNFHKNAGGF
jgi:hypothetical protein